MSKIHITLVGGQPAPVYIGIVHAQPDSVIFVCSSQTKNEVRRVKNEISIPSETMVIDPVSLNDIEASTLELFKRVKEEEISVNISGGTKPWTYFFTRVFTSLENAKLFYVDQNNVIWDFFHREQYFVEFDMDIQFRLYGNPLTNFRKLSKYTEEDFIAIKIIKEIRKINYYDFNKLTYELSNNPDMIKYDLPSGSKIEWNQEKRELSMTLYKRYRNNEKKSIVFDSLNIRELVINTGWFEVEVANLLRKLGNVREIRLNCIFPTHSNTPKNEVDIIINTGNKLLFVECKTQIHKITDIDKFGSAVKIYGGMGSKAIFITDAPMRDDALEKCNDNGILSFSISQNGGVDNCAQSLFKLLEKEMFNINPK